MVFESLLGPWKDVIVFPTFVALSNVIAVSQATVGVVAAWLTSERDVPGSSHAGGGYFEFVYPLERHLNCVKLLKVIHAVCKSTSEGVYIYCILRAVYCAASDTWLTQPQRGSGLNRLGKGNCRPCNSRVYRWVYVQAKFL